ncbi:MAG: ATP-binding protein [Alphaproteobacteria bacterium]|nr:ATP-binding protein [Alphaproteobacteria bacterium]
MKNRPLYLKKLLDFKDKEQIKVITGIRRCGKSKLLDLFIDYLKSDGVSSSHIIKYDFESLKHVGMTYQTLYDEIIKKTKKIKGKVYLFFDEVQRVPQWELAINSFRVDLDADIYITGSNAYLLSSQLSTYLSGRYVEIKMLPLSFKEFLDFHEFPMDMSVNQKFAHFLKFGGMPVLSGYQFNEEPINQVLDGILSTVLVKDVIGQAEVRDVDLLNKILRYLADNVGNMTSVNNIKNFLISEQRLDKKTTAGTVDNYINLLAKAFIFYNILRYDIKGKDYLKTNNKYYIVDLGLRNHLSGFKEMDRGHVLENVVFLELVRRGYQVCIGTNVGKEVDFIASKVNEKLYIQVTETLMDKQTRERELSSLKTIKDNYPKFVLSMDEVFTNTNDEGIQIVNIIDWLLASQD